MQRQIGRYLWLHRNRLESRAGYADVPSFSRVGHIDTDCRRLGQGGFMKTGRVMAGALAGAAILCLLSLQRSAGEPKQDELPSVEELASEMTRLRARIDELEHRVAVLEAKPGPLEVDHHGVIRTPAGKPVGFWGFDWEEF
jgi:hypothetical protein